MSDGHLPLVRGHRQSGVRLQRSPNTERCLPSLGDHSLFYTFVVLPDLALLFLRSEVSLIDQDLLGIWTVAFFTPCQGDCIHGPGIPWFVACLFPVVNFPPPSTSSSEQPPRVHRRCLGNHPSATFFRQRLTFTKFPIGIYLDISSSKKFTNVTLWTRFRFCLPCFGKL